MNYRNAQYTANGWIDCEIEHETYGWIPFTCDPNDTGASFDTKALFDRMVSNGTVAPYVPPSVEEVKAIAWEQLRSERDVRLEASDIYVLPDRWTSYSTTKQAEWASYRQSLRDLPANTTDPFNPIWPNTPK